MGLHGNARPEPNKDRNHKKEVNQINRAIRIRRQIRSFDLSHHHPLPEPCDRVRIVAQLTQNPVRMVPQWRWGAMEMGGRLGEPNRRIDSFH